MKKIFHKYVLAMQGCLLAAASAGALAQPPERPGSAQNGDPLSNERLDALRGGLEVNSLLMSLGIERAIFINGELATLTRLNVPGVNSGASFSSAPPAGGKLASPGAAAPGGSNASAPRLVSQNANSFSVVQNGAGNTVALPANLPSAGNIVQNTLDSQTIRSVTTINASVLSNSIMQGLRLNAAMSSVAPGH
jgi:hypothetical protein